MYTWVIRVNSSIGTMHYNRTACTSNDLVVAAIRRRPGVRFGGGAIARPVDGIDCGGVGILVAEADNAWIIVVAEA